MGRPTLFVLLLLGVLAPATAHAQTETVEYYALDAIGSVRVVFDANGGIVARSDYTPFGAELSSSPKAPDRKFAGLFRDAEAGLDYAQARSYQVRTGRFTAPDPVLAGLNEPQLWNRYAYSKNSPFRYTDPTGLLVESPFERDNFCGAEYSFGACGGNDLFWAEYQGAGFEFGAGYAGATARGYVPGMPAEVWEALQAFNDRVDNSMIAAFLENAETETVHGDVAAWPFVLQRIGSAITQLKPAAQEGLKQLLILLGQSPSLRSGNVSAHSLAHILQKHGPGSIQKAGKFASGTTDADILNMINSALRNGTIRPNSFNRQGHIFELDFGRVIGTDILGAPSTRLRVVRTPPNVISTAFPY